MQPPACVGVAALRGVCVAKFVVRFERRRSDRRLNNSPVTSPRMPSHDCTRRTWLALAKALRRLADPPENQPMSAIPIPMSAEQATAVSKPFPRLTIRRSRRRTELSRYLAKEAITPSS